MTMDFYPPRVERPGRGIRFLLIAVPIGVIGYWVISWSLLAIAVFMIFLGLVEVLLYRRGAGTRAIRRGRTSLLATGSIVVVLSVIGGSAISVVRGTASIANSAPSPVMGSTSDATLLGALIGVGAGVASLIYFTRRFSEAGGADAR